MLRRMGLQNFKCWRELDVALAPITLFFGANSSGKTAILQSLLMLKQTARGFDPDQHINFGGRQHDYVDLGSYRDLAYSHDQTLPLGVKLRWDIVKPLQQPKFNIVTNRPDVLANPLTTDFFDTLEYYVAWDISESIQIKGLEFAAIDNWRSDHRIKLNRYENDKYEVSISDPFFFYRDDNYDWHVDNGFEERGTIAHAPSNCYVLPDLRFGRKGTFPVWNPTRALNKEFENLVDALRYLGPLRVYPKRLYIFTGGITKSVSEPDGADAIHALISSARSDGILLQYVEDHLKNLEVVDGFHVEAIDQFSRMYEINVTQAGSKNALIDVGFGVSQVLPVITMLLSAPEGSIVLLEQPELHLHPNAQAALADLFIQVAEQRQLQLIIECHSEHIVRRLQRRIAEDQPAFACPENIKLFYCQPGENGSTATQLDLDRFGQINNWPDKFLGDTLGDMFSMSRAALDRRVEELRGG